MNWLQNITYNAYFENFGHIVQEPIYGNHFVFESWNFLATLHVLYLDL